MGLLKDLFAGGKLGKRITEIAKKGRKGGKNMIKDKKKKRGGK